MASIYKRGGRKGSRAAPWIVSYSDEYGRRHEKRAGPDKSVAEQIARELESKVALRKAGVLDTREERWGECERVPLADHLADFAAALRAKGNTEKHCGMTEAHCGRIITLAKARKLSDLTPSRVQRALADLRADGRSLSTCNHALRAIKSFSRWLAADGRTRSLAA